MGHHKIWYARVSTPIKIRSSSSTQLEAEGCLKVYKDTATGAKADRPAWAWKTCVPATL